MAQPNIKIVHESETQRQHVRLHIPSRVQIEGTSYHVSDLSSGGFSADGFSKPMKAGQSFPVVLVLPFDSFALDLSLQAEVLHQETAQGVLGCRFVDLTTSQLSVLNYVVKAFIAGDVITAGDVIAVVSRDNFVKMRQTKPGVAPEDSAVKTRRMIGLALVACLFLCAVAFVLANIFEKAFMLKTTDARIAGLEITVSMPQGGVYSAALPKDMKRVSKDQVIGSYTPAMGGAAIEIKSPCDCLISWNKGVDGVLVSEGTKIMNLVALNSEPTIEALVPMKDVQSIRTGQMATVVVAGTDADIQAEVTDVTTQQAQQVTGETMIGKVMLKTRQPLPTEMVGRPASVYIKM